MSSCAETGIDVVSLVSVSITVPSDVNVAKPDIAFGALPASGIRVNSRSQLIDWQVCRFVRGQMVSPVRSIRKARM